MLSQRVHWELSVHWPKGVAPAACRHVSSTLEVKYDHGFTTKTQMKDYHNAKEIAKAFQ